MEILQKPSARIGSPCASERTNLVLATEREPSVHEGQRSENGQRQPLFAKDCDHIAYEELRVLARYLDGGVVTVPNGGRLAEGSN